MGDIKYKLNTKESLNRWLVSEIFEEPKKFKPISMNYEGDLNRWLIEGFSIFENPNRKEFVRYEVKKPKERISFPTINPGDMCEVDGVKRKWDLYFPWKNQKVEKSGFWQTPTHLKAWAYTKLKAEKSQIAQFNLYTCGSVTIWINGQIIKTFSPYTRNEEKMVLVELPLNEGENEILVLFEDLAERDTLFYFRLEYLNNHSLQIILPIGESKADDIYGLEQALNETYFSADVFKEGNVYLQFENPLDSHIELTCTLKTEWWGESKKLICRVPAKAKEISLGEVENIGFGNYLIDLAIHIDSINIQKSIFLQLYPESNMPKKTYSSIEERKRALIEFIAENGSNDLHKAYAMAVTKRNLTKIAEIVQRTLMTINKRYDCSDFYLITLFRFWNDFREKDIFDESLWNECKQAILNYRYWYDEPGDDVMWFFSENHALLFHTCEFLAGKLFPDEIFPNANITGNEHAEKAKDRLVKWFEKFKEEGLAEWNSSAYIPINAMGFLQLYDLSGDSELKRFSKEALDTTFKIMALNSFEGYLSCTYGRIYEKELKGNYNNATTALLWVAYGKGNMNHSTFATVAFGISDYIPPDLTEYSDLSEREHLIFKHHQGSKGFVDIYTYKNKHNLLSSAINYRPGDSGYSEHIVHSTLSPETIVWVNHPGEVTELGTGRPSFWAGNGILPKVDQYRDLAIVHYQVNEQHEIGYTHAYFPIFAFDEVDTVNQWYFGRKDKSYIAIFANNGLKLKTEGQNKNREIVSLGRENIWIIRNSSAEQFENFEAFKNAILLSSANVTKGYITFEDPIYGIVRSSWSDRLQVNGNTQSHSGYTVGGVVDKWKSIH